MESTPHTLQSDIMAASLVRLTEEGWGNYAMQQADRGRRPSEKPACRVNRRIKMMSASWNQLFFQILLLFISCGHISTKTPGPTPSPLAPISPLPTDVRSVVFTGKSHTENVELLNPVKLELNCTWNADENKPRNISGYWTKDGIEIENSRVLVQNNNSYNLHNTFSILDEPNLGTYSCVFGNESKIDFILSVPQIGDMRDKPIIGYVGDYVVFACKMDETKPKPDSWNWSKKNGTEKEILSTAAEPQRYNVQTQTHATKLMVHNLTEADSGLYICTAVYALSSTYSQVELKVITLWEPLKPFLVILVEVIFLVAAILLYERSQSKKNCATENGPNPDQTNTLTQEENNDQEGNSSVRQRKV